MAFSSLHKPLFAEHDSIYFANSGIPPAGDNNAFCEVSYHCFFVCPSVSVLLVWRLINMKDSLKTVFQHIHFIKVYNNAPSVFVSANHTSTGGNQDPMHNSITAWVEVTQQDQTGECYRNNFTKDISQGKTIQELTCNMHSLLLLYRKRKLKFVQFYTRVF